jgi:hypothetical protein
MVKLWSASRRGSGNIGMRTQVRLVPSLQDAVIYRRLGEQADSHLHCSSTPSSCVPGPRNRSSPGA